MGPFTKYCDGDGIDASGNGRSWGDSVGPPPNAPAEPCHEVTNGSAALGRAVLILPANPCPSVRSVLEIGLVQPEPEHKLHRESACRQGYRRYVRWRPGSFPLAAWRLGARIFDIRSGRPHVCLGDPFNHGKSGPRPRATRPCTSLRSSRSLFRERPCLSVPVRVLFARPLPVFGAAVVARVVPVIEGHPRKGGREDVHDELVLTQAFGLGGHTNGLVEVGRQFDRHLPRLV